MQIKKSKANSKANTGNVSRNGECIGLDITPQAIHTVLLNARSLNQIRLEKYAITPLPANVVGDSGIEDHDQLVSYLQQAMRQLGSSCKNITASIPSSLATVQTLNYDPRQTELDVEEFAEFEVSQTSSLDSSSYDYYVLPETLGSHPQTVVVVSCKRDDVDVRLDVLGAANITPKQMDVDVLAVLNAVNTWINNEQPNLASQYVATFQLGYRTTTAIIARGNHILYKQEINLGHDHLAQMIRRQFHLGEEEAWAMLHSADKPADFKQKVGDQFQQQLLQEIQRFLQFYYTTQGDHSADVQHILICDYPSGADISPHINQQVNIPTQQIYPVNTAQAGSKLDAHRLAADAMQLTVAFGLAMRGL